MYLAKICTLMFSFLFLYAYTQEKKQLPFDNKQAAIDIKKVFDHKNDCLLTNDYESISKIIHPSLVYGHSNCWVQDANDIIGVSPTDSLSYIAINAGDINVDAVGGTGLVYGIAQFKGIYKQDTFDLKLCFVETYTYVDNTWQLLARQAAKIPIK